MTRDFRGIRVVRANDPSGIPSATASLYACNFDELAYEVPEKGHGVFSYYLLEGMRGGATDNNGEITVTGLADYTQKKVTAWAQEQKGIRQTP